MTRRLMAAALLAAPAWFWGSPALAGVCKNNWGDVTPGGQSSQSACEAIGGRWENAQKVEEPATGTVRVRHEVKEPESGRVRFSAPPQESGPTAPAGQAVEKLPPDEERATSQRRHLEISGRMAEGSGVSIWGDRSRSRRLHYYGPPDTRWILSRISRSGDTLEAEFISAGYANSDGTWHEPRPRPDNPPANARGVYLSQLTNASTFTEIAARTRLTWAFARCSEVSAATYQRRTGLTAFCMDSPESQLVTQYHVVGDRARPVGRAGFRFGRLYVDRSGRLVGWSYERLAPQWRQDSAWRNYIRELFPSSVSTTGSFYAHLSVRADASRATASPQLEKPDTYAAPGRTSADAARSLPRDLRLPEAGSNIPRSFSELVANRAGSAPRFPDRLRGLSERQIRSLIKRDEDIRAGFQDWYCYFFYSSGDAACDGWHGNHI